MPNPEDPFHTQVYDRSNMDAMALIPQRNYQQIGELKENDWLAAYPDALVGARVYLSQLRVVPSPQSYAYMRQIDTQIRSGDSFGVSVSVDECLRTNVEAFARGRIYNPRIPLRKSYAYFPNALGHSPEALDEAIWSIAGKLIGRKGLVVVDTLRDNQDHQQILEEIGFDPGQTKTMPLEGGLADFLGPTYPVLQFVRKQG